MFNYQGMSVQQVREGVQKFGPAVGARKVIDQEYLHAQEAINNGVYITFCLIGNNDSIFNRDTKNAKECFRIGSTSKCFCTHPFSNHKQICTSKRFDSSCTNCNCKRFKFVPTRPEECGMYWLVRRKDFNVLKWRPPCKCTHGTNDHDPTSFHCKQCKCSSFQANYACISCDQNWDKHDILWEEEHERRHAGKPVGKAYLPLSQNPDIQEEVFRDPKYHFQDQIEQNPNQFQQMQQQPGNDNPFPPPKPFKQITPAQMEQLKQNAQYTTPYTRARPASLNKTALKKKK